MPRNVEIKARLDNFSAVAAKAAALADHGPIAIAQDDTFFRCDNGRLKLRVFSETQGELIFYRRTDRQGPKESFYMHSPTASPASLREALTLAHGEIGRVVKDRTLYLLGRTRIHLDKVQGLGEFLELEVVLEDGEPLEAGVREAHRLMADLGIAPSQLVGGAYVDLLTKALR
ncbi:MAG: class IV adenylate cyclase [Hydrogenophaga sp.]|uniref:class IV adenylate cyclase n=1 Tax=Hydrogenophaga sp. TaxID=1904254 RepID=UPI0025BBEBDD|nr:class IV adenylate cyclase [Hydrogenophaga sp.]MBU7573675.1 class IV adenylate cyclase [Hydrogenophaga sp.]